MEINLSYLPDDMVRLSGFGQEDAGVVELHVVSQVDAELWHS
jgi:hypothetical protein